MSMKKKSMFSCNVVYGNYMLGLGDGLNNLRKLLCNIIILVQISINREIPSQFKSYSSLIYHSNPKSILLLRPLRFIYGVIGNPMNTCKSSIRIFTKKTTFELKKCNIKINLLEIKFKIYSNHVHIIISFHMLPQP